MEKTRDYARFKLTDDNRDGGVKEIHVQRLIDSIKAKNLLELRPIIVNNNWEVIDGQHRLEAAKRLGVDIYYEVKADTEKHDIILLNIAEKWQQRDYLNYYVKNGYPEYIKLDTFLKRHNMNLRTYLGVAIGRTHEKHETFRSGAFVMPNTVDDSVMAIVKQTREIINTRNGGVNSIYTQTGRFFGALLSLFRHPQFEEGKWISNLDRMTSNFSIRATTREYISDIQKVYNWRNPNRIDLVNSAEYSAY